MSALTQRFDIDNLDFGYDLDIGHDRSADTCWPRYWTFPRYDLDNGHSYGRPGVLKGVGHGTMGGTEGSGPSTGQWEVLKRGRGSERVGPGSRVWGPRSGSLGDSQRYWSQCTNNFWTTYPIWSLFSVIGSDFYGESHVLCMHVCVYY